MKRSCHETLGSGGLGRALSSGQSPRPGGSGCWKPWSHLRCRDSAEHRSAVALCSQLSILPRVSPSCVPGTAPRAALRNPFQAASSAHVSRSQQSTGTATPRHDNLVSLIMALRPTLIDTRVFPISQNACYRKQLCKLPFGRGGSTQSVPIWPK